MTKPSQANWHTFDEAVEEVTAPLLAHLESRSPKKDRETGAAKAKARVARRYGVA